MRIHGDSIVQFISASPSLTLSMNLLMYLVHVGAFRTYPEGYKPPDEGPQEYQSIPMDKVEDFGVHCKSYYPLEVSYFKSPLEKNIINMLWYKYWLNSLSADAANAEESHLNTLTADLAKKIENIAFSVSISKFPALITLIHKL